MIETKLNGKTPDIAEENVAKLKEIFPDVFCEGKIDFEKLQQVLGNYIEDEKERYDFTWNGKGRARRLAQSSSTGTLRPCKEESKNWDSTENLYIEGDNLEVLKLLQKTYHGKIKMIYIDKTISRLIRHKLQTPLISRLFHLTDPRGLIFLHFCKLWHFGYGARLNELYIIERTKSGFVHFCVCCRFFS